MPELMWQVYEVPAPDQGRWMRDEVHAVSQARTKALEIGDGTRPEPRHFERSWKERRR